MLKKDPLKRVLYIDLSHKKYWVEERPELFEERLGGVGVATKLLEEECPKGVDPFSPENPIIFAVGPLNGAFPLASKVVAMFKSPHTKNLGESHAGGRSAIAIRLAGYGAIVIKGASNIPVYVVIDRDRVYFRDATALWGMRSVFTVGRIIREREPGAGLRTIMRIGKAGESLVEYACVTTETYRHFGRLGLGAVFGSKKLKALVVVGDKSFPVKNPKAYREIYDEIYKKSVESPLMKKYHDLGTPQNVLKLNAAGALPTMNLKMTRFEHADKLSGEHLAENFLGRRLACSHCPVGCIHIAALREPYEDEPYFYKTSMISYDYETIYSLGTMVGIKEPEGYLRLIDTVEEVGLDAMSTGVTLAWATEAMERGLITEKDTLGVKFEWGNWREYIKAVKNIVDQPNDFYKVLAKGVDFASSVYGGREFALCYGRNEMPGYHTGPASHLGFMFGARHSHLDNAGYSIDQTVLKERALSPEELADEIIKEECWRQVQTSLVICLFARGIYDKETVLRALDVMGFKLSEVDIDEIGKKIFADKYRFKFREGFSLERNVRFPERIFEVETPLGKIDRGFLEDTAKSLKEKILAMVE